MNIEKNLIFIKGEDKTEKIEYCKYENGKWHIQFIDNNKSYSYNYNNVRWLTKPVELNSTTTIIYENNQPISGIVKIFKFEDYIRLCFKKGYKKLYPISSVVIEETCLKNKNSNNCFEYLKQLSESVSISLDDDSSFLSKQYKNIRNISPRSVLSLFLSPKEFEKRENTQQIIFPFGFNLSQKDATEKALINQISVIEGPPGTGKTQTILNIIANAIINDKTVAVVSNNNSATANVLEKLQKYGVDFIAAYLGNKENKARFFSTQTGSYPDFNEWKMESDELERIKSDIVSCQSRLNNLLDKQNKLAILNQEISELKIEIGYFNKYYTQKGVQSVSYTSVYKLNSDRVMKLLIEYEMTIEKYDSLSIKHKIKNLIRYGIVSLKFYKNSNENIVEHLKKMYYELKLKELERKANQLSKELENFHFDKAMKEYSEKSMTLLKANLAKRFSKKENRNIYSKDDLWKNCDGFIKEYPVILSTTHSLRSCASENYLFDYVIIDEASQVDIVTGALAFSCAKNAVVVGDLKQLPNVVSAEVESKSKMIFEGFDLNPAYSYHDNSLLSSIVKLFSDVPKTLLREHYRCHPKIIGFCNKKFYNDELIILTNEDINDKALVAYKTVKGNHARGNYNQRQIDVILEEVIPTLNKEKIDSSIGIISPYRLQTEELKKAIGDTNIEADTVHKYQGREKDIIILTTVADEINDFIDNPNLINVAVSRAVDKLVIVVPENYSCSENTNIGDLINYIQYNNFEAINSSIFSVFDFLYKGYSEKLLEILSKNKKVSNYNSENLMNIVIEKVLGLDEFANLDKVMHQPLKMLISDTSKLSEAEYKFATNILTHTDFVIFNKIDKMPVLVVEVDGYAFHANNPKQLERDKMKDEILKKYDIPILRVKTNESNEELKLYNKLSEIINIKNA